MMGNDFISIDHIHEIGEIIFCVYFTAHYEMKRAVQFMSWKGFRTDLMYTYNDLLVFYQDERFIPVLDTENQFRRCVNDRIWDNAPCNIENTYRYRDICSDICCISFLPDINATTEKTGKIKKE